MKQSLLKAGLMTLGGACLASSCANQAPKQPNILFIMSDDHAKQAISAYGGILADILPTPNLDRIAHEGIMLNNCFVTNSISTPSRGAIMTGQYSQCNGVYTLVDALNPQHPNVAKCLQEAGYQTAIVGKWHLHAEPTGFDWYNILPGQGRYRNPILIEKGMWNADPTVDEGERAGKVYEGHSTDVIASQAMRFMDERDPNKPFFLMCHFKAPHRNWVPAERFNDLLKDVTVPEPENIFDTYEGKGQYAQLQELSLEDMNRNDMKQPLPEGLTRDEMRSWVYQNYIKDYLRCIAGVDENVGRILQYLDDHNLAENTVVIYTGDQGFFLGEHGWFDKRLMYEECLRMPFLMRYPREIKPGTINNDITLNIDFAPLFMDYARAQKPDFMQGESFRANLTGKTPADWRKAMYYRYWTNCDYDHNITAHYGIRTQQYKLIYFYGLSLGMPITKDMRVEPAEWELYDLQNDPMEMHNIYQDPQYQPVIKELKEKLLELKDKYKDPDSKYPEMVELNKSYFW